VAGTTTSADGDQVWNCGSCGERNYFWREFCGRCKRPCLNPYGSDKLAQTRKVWSTGVCVHGVFAPVSTLYTGPAA
jgi:hypothetical protein